MAVSNTSITNMSCDDGGKLGARGLPSELMIWLSPAFPVGGFAYSQGLETALAKGWAHDCASLVAWLTPVVRHGALRNDLILIGMVIRARGQAEIEEIAELSAALQPTSERVKEAGDQGTSFWAAYITAWQRQCSGREPNPHQLTLPIAVATAARDYGFAVPAVLEAYGVAYVSSQISAAIRLGVVGQFDGQRIIAGLLPDIRHLSAFAATASVDDLGTATFGADLASLQHETQTTRLFRS